MSRAVLCTRCRQLISGAETRCPFCQAAQPNLGGAGPGLLAFFRDVQVTDGLVGLMGLLYAVSLAIDPPTFRFEDGLFAIGAPSSRALSMLGMTGGPAWSCGQVWTLLTATFLHGGLLHILFNLSWLRQLGSLTQDLLGPARFFVLFIVSGVSGFLLSNLVTNAPTIGASCGLFGMYGALMVFGKRRGGTLGAGLSRQMLSWAVSGFLFTLMMGNVNHMGHLGGFLGGAGAAFFMPKFENVRESRGVMLLAVALGALTLLAFVLSGLASAGLLPSSNPLCAAALGLR